jgi:NADH-quinone oxidoreductase subunit M
MRERLVFAPLILLIFWMGVAPQPFLDRMQPTLDRVIAQVQQRAAEQAALAAPATPEVPATPVVPETPAPIAPVPTGEARP